MTKKGYKQTEEHKRYGKDNHFYGKKHTEKAKALIGEASKLRPSGKKGKKLSKETRRRIRLNHADVSGENNPNYGKKGELSPLFGRKHSKGTIRKMRLRKIGRKNPMFGKLSPNRHTKYKGGYYKGIWLRSSYEIAYAGWLDKENISWKYETKTFDLGNCTYTPDFYIIKKNKFCEIKGWWTEKAKAKFRLFRKLYPHIKISVLDANKLIDMGIINHK